jgi:threonine/homoserine efflux transporter RhtA
MRRTFVFVSLLTMLGTVAGMGALREHPDLAQALAVADARAESDADASGETVEQEDAAGAE